MKSFLVISFLFQMAFAADEGFYSFKVKKSSGQDVSMSDYKNKAVLVVNVASKCGFTSQYEGLQALYKKYEAKGLVILGFPANNFFKQEPGANEEIQKFCKLNYGVTFPVFAKISVKGSDIDPLYKWLTTQKGFEGEISWNFNKFLIQKNGQLFDRYASSIKPEDIEADIKKALEIK